MADEDSDLGHYNGADYAPRGDPSTSKRKKKAASGIQNPKAVKLRKKLVARSRQLKVMKIRKQTSRTGLLERHRIAKLEKDLEEEKARNALLVEAMNKMREETEPNDEVGGEEPMSDAGEELVDQSTIESEGIVPSSTQRPRSIEFKGVEPSSTQRPRNISALEESKFMTSINQLSVSSICVPECKPTAENEEISRHAFEQWRDLLIDSMHLAGITDEATKFTVFKVKAGPRLLDIYRNAKADADAPDANLFPFAHALYRLKAYFGSGSDIMLQRRRLALMEQKSDESDLAFITRVGSTARLCDYGKEKEFEEIVGTIAEHAQTKEVRTTALKLLSRNGTFNDLVDKVREIEAIRLNEQFFSQKHGLKKDAIVAPVRADFPIREGDQQRYQGRTINQRGYRGNSAGTRRTGFQVSSRNLGVRTGFNSQRNGSVPQGNRCWRCNSVYHVPNKCHAINKDCRNCGRFGHIQIACPLASRTAPHESTVQESAADSARKTIAVVEKREETAQSQEIVPLKQNTAMAATVTPTNDDGFIKAKVAGMSCRFLIDSGAQVNTFTEDMFSALMANEVYSGGVYNVKQESDRSLKGYASDGTIEVSATFEAYMFISNDRPTFLEKFYVVKEFQALLGRFTASRYSILMLGVKVPIATGSFIDPSPMPGEISAIDTDEKFPKFNVPPVRIEYNKSAPPCRNVFMNIPHALRSIVEERLRKLEMTDIIERVTDEMNTSFCSSMLVVPKGKDDIRLVIDLRGPNRYVYRTPFAMPTLEGILVELHGAKWFSTIDLSNAFFHIELDRDSRHLTNFCTEFGMFRFVRLPFGLCNAPDVFQETMQRKILGDCKGVRNYQDDVLVFGRTKEEHDENLAAVLDKLRNHNVRMNESKCVFGSQKVTFLGFTLTSEGWKIEEEKLCAIENCRRPENCSEVKSFLGLVTFVDRFIPNRADLTQYLRALANADRFYWTDNEELEFNYLKTGALKTIRTLGYYSQTDPIELYVDASPVGLGAVLVQQNKDQSSRIIACASKALTPTEKRYPQTHKEALAVVWGVERFSTYLLSKSFVIRTDAEANQFIFNGTHRLGKRALSRADAWALRLQSFDFTIERVPGNMNVADALSRLICQTQDPVPVEDDDENHFLYALDAGHMNLTWGEIEKRTEEDNVLRKVRTALQSGFWPNDLQKYEAQKKNLRFLGFLLFKDDRAVLPEALRQTAMQSAHGGHVGIVSMKKIMRQFFWWPGMSTAVENFVKDCEVCVQLSRKNPPIPLSSRVLPEGPWEVLQIDFLKVPGFGSGEFLVVLDTYSRYLNVVEMKQTDAEKTNAALCGIFRQWGCPLTIQSDNGPPFQSASFTKYWEDKGVKVLKSIPLCPQTNGAVERQNPGITKALTASKLEGSNWRHALEQYVHHRNTLVPHSRLGITPFELMVGWRYRGTFTSLWHPSKTELDRLDVRERDDHTKLKSKKDADEFRGARESAITVGDTVLLAQQRRSKTDAFFSSERFQVVAREGAKVVLMSANGVQYSRNVNDIRKAPISVPVMVDENSTTTVEIGPQNTEGIEVLPELNSPLDISDAFGADSQRDSKSASRSLRRRTDIQRPSRFDDNFVYRIFN